MNEEIGVAVDDHWHSEVTHLASAISVRDLWEHLKKASSRNTYTQSRVAALAVLAQDQTFDGMFALH